MLCSDESGGVTGYGETQRKDVESMEIIRIKEMPAAVNPRGVRARHLINRPAVVVTNLMLEPGEVVQKHVTPVDVFFYVVEGRGTIEIGDETGEAQAGEIVVSPASIPHGLRAAADSRFTVLVVKTPNPVSNPASNREAEQAGSK